MTDIVSGQVRAVVTGGTDTGTLWHTSGAVGVSSACSTCLGVVLSKEVVSEGANCAISSCVAGFHIGDTILLIGGVSREPIHTARAGGCTSGRAGSARISTSHGAGVDGGEGVALETCVANRRVEAGSAACHTGLAGSTDCVEEVSDIAATAGRLVSC